MRLSMSVYTFVNVCVCVVRCAFMTVCTFKSVFVNVRVGVSTSV